MAPVEKQVLLVIADISGYTRFIAVNRTSLAHSQIIISELMRALLKELKVPLRVSKLEGDAVFFYLCKEGNEQSIEAAARSIRPRIDRMFAAFDRRIAELVQSNTCPCAGCKSVEMLRLKMVVHSGTALFFRLDRFAELSGIDVILVHRLLKNNVHGDTYVLLTESARKELFARDENSLDEGEEHYDEVGTVKTFTYRPRPIDGEIVESAFDTPFHRWKTHQIKVWRGRLRDWGVMRFRPFRHLPAEPGELTGEA